MALTIKKVENAMSKAKNYKMLDGGGFSLLVCRRVQALASAIAVQWRREEYDIRGVPGCRP
jgi:hypothetical protein